MSKYTTEVRFICETASGLGESKGHNDTNSIIDLAIPKVFNFDFPIFDEKYRVVLEKKILKHFYTREIGEETVGLWKLRLDTRMNEIMPYYNKLYVSELLDFNPLYTHNLTRSHEGTSKNISNETVNTSNNGSVNSTNHNETNSNGSGSNTGKSTDKYSDAPQGGLANIESGTYLTNARIVDENSNSNSSSHNESDSSGNVTSIDSGNTTSNSNANTTENYLETVVGYEGKNASKLLQDYRETFLNIDMLIINNLEDLFMQLW